VPNGRHQRSAHISAELAPVTTAAHGFGEESGGILSFAAAPGGKLPISTDGAPKRPSLTVADALLPC
jgi:hypothetical protein